MSLFLNAYLKILQLTVSAFLDVKTMDEENTRIYAPTRIISALSFDWLKYMLELNLMINGIDLLLLILCFINITLLLFSMCKFAAKICLLTSFRDTCFIEIIPQHQPPKCGKYVYLYHLYYMI